MNFDFEYVTTTAESVSKGIDVDWRIIFIVVGIVVFAVMVFAVIFLIRNKSNDSVDYVVGEGTVFCSKCFNEFDSGLAKCPFCKHKKL